MELDGGEKRTMLRLAVQWPPGPIAATSYLHESPPSFAGTLRLIILPPHKVDNLDVKRPAAAPGAEMKSSFHACMQLPGS